MAATGEAKELRPGEPRTPEAAAFLERFDRRMQLPIVLAAVVPLILGLGKAPTLVEATVYGVSWLVFLADLVVHCRYCHHYLRTGRGKFDLAIVVLTAPWFLVLPSEQSGSKFIVVVRLARLVRLFIASRAARHLLQRIGRAAIVALIMVFVCAYVTFEAEKDVNPEFATYADSLWWGVVTITTVGYGDKVPITTIGRWSAVVLMITGVGIIGTLAGSLASFLRLDSRKSSREDAAGEAGATGEAAAAPTAAPAPSIADLRAQLADLDRQLAAMEAAEHPTGDPAT